MSENEIFAKFLFFENISTPLLLLASCWSASDSIPMSVFDAVVIILYRSKRAGVIRFFLS